MHLYRTLYLFILLSLAVISGTVYAYNPNGGIVMKSYEVAPDERTSITVPSENMKEFVFSKTFCLSFDNRIETNKEPFGYVCRIIVDGISSVDVILVNPVDSMPHIVIVANGNESPKRFSLVSAIHEWHKISVSLESKKEGLVLNANGRRLCILELSGFRHTARLFFGLNRQGRFSTTDVAPAVIDNLRISDGRRNYMWRFTYSRDTEVPDSSCRAYAQLSHPVWQMERNLRWKHETDVVFPSKVFVVTDYRNSIWFIGSGMMTKLRMPGMKISENSFGNPVPTGMLTNNFIILPDGGLAYYDFDSETVPLVMYDEDACDWSSPITREKHSPYLHHNVFYNVIDSSIVQLFGYGYHSYSNNMYRYRVGENILERSQVREIFPRYLASVGLRDSIAYIYGGKGNTGGIQELGAVISNDFYMMNINDYRVRKVWEIPADSSELASGNLIVSRDGSSFRALVYSPMTCCTGLQLTEFSTSEGKFRKLADRIPYYFIDTESDARLLYDEVNSAMYAVTVHQRGTDYVASIYSICCPVLSEDDFVASEAGTTNMLWWLVSSVLAIVVSASVYAVFRHRSKTAGVSGCQLSDSSEETINETVASDTIRPGIFIVGGFRVINSDGKDITASFSHQIRQLLCLIVLYTKTKGGISSGELKDALWFDKSDESYQNNRGVYVRKLRLLMETVAADIRISNDNGIWSIECSDSNCDYFHNMSVLEKNSDDTGSMIGELVSIAMQGHLLPDIQADWLDSFKSMYDNSIISRLVSLRDSDTYRHNPRALISISDAILVFDSLDEVTMKTKCRALASLRKFGTAKDVFDRFTKEYASLMGEKYPQSFTDFIR